MFSLFDDMLVISVPVTLTGILVIKIVISKRITRKKFNKKLFVVEKHKPMFVFMLLLLK